jgi:hypothetical protein
MRGCLQPTELIYWWLAYPSKTTRPRLSLAAIRSAASLVPSSSSRSSGRG